MAVTFQDTRTGKDRGTAYGGLHAGLRSGDRGTTPHLLQTALGSIWLLTLLFLTAALTGAHQHRQALQVIGRETAARIIGAQRLKAGLSDLDAAAANVLLLPPGTRQEQADDQYEAKRVAATEDLERAAQKAADGTTEQQAVQSLGDALGTYEADVALARLLHLRGEPGSRLVYRMTHSEIHDILLPAADALNKAEDVVLQTTYRRQQAASSIGLILVWISGLLTLTLLIATQIFLSRRMHRTLNPSLLGATLILLFLLIYTGAMLSRESDTLHTARDQFALISDLWQTRATMFDASSEESRWLMDTPQAPQYEQAFFADASQVAAPAPGQSLGAVLAGLDQGSLPDSFQGNIATELRGAKFPGEQETAREVLRTYAVYSGIDGQIRTLENKGNHGAAVALCVGLQPGQQGWAFTQFDHALDTALSLDQHVFDAEVTDGLGQLGGYDVLAVLAALAIAALTGIGLQERLREYAF